ncbi:YdcF family protein [Nocardia arizonensis]|uniref:YdcF family protein n=1 Tax=Nocardia arizonensis TaxID=1141647 RepID=UPI0006D1C677|nr:YdcF family protein [Nocardia arizonensis]
MILLAIGLGLLAVFAVRFLTDRRRLGNGLFLLLGAIFTGVWALTLGNGSALPLLALVLVILAPLLMMAPAGSLLLNGVQLVRREGIRPHTVLPVGAAAVFLVPYALYVTAYVLGNSWFTVVTASVTLVVGYFGLLLLAFLLYAYLYGHLGYRAGMDAIVVHGCGLVDGRVSPLLASRLDRAVAVYRAEVAAGRTPVIVTSGGRGPDEEVAEAEAMSDYLVAGGLPPEVILREDRSTDTRENLLFTEGLLTERGGTARLVLVTSNFHVLRTAILARELGLDAEVIGARTALYYLPTAILREFVALVVRYRWTNILACLVLAALPPIAVLAVGDAAA